MCNAKRIDPSTIPGELHMRGRQTPKVDGQQSQKRIKRDLNQLGWSLSKRIKKNVIVSKAALRSSKIRIIDFLASRAIIMSFDTIRRAISVN